MAFDLDSTLFNVAPRMEKILREFADQPEHRERFPEHIPHFSKIRVQRGDWDLLDSLERAGLNGATPEFEASLREFWFPRFFSNPYLHFDEPYPGARSYVQTLVDRGADIVYLTGRDVHRLGHGTREVLRKWKFPLDEKRARLALKPDKTMDDPKFKTDWFVQLPRDAYHDIWFFENEPANIHPLRLEVAHVKVVFFDSTHSRVAPKPRDLPTVLHYLLHEGGDIAAGARVKKDS